jgi:hypothetical protein
MEILPLRHRFRLTYLGATQEKQQRVGSDPTVTYQTELVTMELKYSTGIFIEDSEAAVTWQPGSRGSYRDFGDGIMDSDGSEQMEILPLRHRFRLTYLGATQEKQQRVGSDPIVTYQTVNAIVELKDSGESFIEGSGATVTWQPGSKGSYRNFGDGTMDSDGSEEMEILPLKHRFRLTYQECTQEKQQHVGSDETVTYQTHEVIVQLVDGSGDPVPDSGAAVKWQSGSSGSYADFGDGILDPDGTEGMEVLPLKHRYRMTYNGDTVEKQTKNTPITYYLSEFPPLAAPQLAARWCLESNFPNPFNPETWIPYGIAEASDVTIRIYDSVGRLIRNLALGYQTPGLYISKDTAAYWDGRNESGEQVASGLYFYTIQAGEFTATKKMTVKR